MQEKHIPSTTSFLCQLAQSVVRVRFLRELHFARNGGSPRETPVAEPSTPLSPGAVRPGAARARCLLRACAEGCCYPSDSGGARKGVRRGRVT